MAFGRARAEANPKIHSFGYPPKKASPKYISPAPSLAAFGASVLYPFERAMRIENA